MKTCAFILLCALFAHCAKELLNSNGTRRFLQTDNELPIDWRNGSPYFLPAGTYRIRVQRNGTTHFDYTIHIR